MPNMILSGKEREKYAEAERALRTRFGEGNVRCYWELAKPKASNFAMLAGFTVIYDGAPRYCIIQVYLKGAGWEIFAAPHSIRISDSMENLATLWDMADTRDLYAKAGIGGKE